MGIFKWINELADYFLMAFVMIMLLCITIIVSYNKGEDDE